MENQHREIKGYRELTPAEIALMNSIKAKGEELGALIAMLRSFPATPASGVPGLADGSPTIDQRWVSIGATHLQEGLMALTRAVAQPSTF